MKKAIFFDVDGTLIDCLNGINSITPRVEQAIRSLQKNGNYVFIASGRPYAFISKELLNFGFDGFVLTNGTHIIFNDKVIYRKSINKDFIKKVASDFEKFHIEYILQGEVYSYIKEEFKDLYSYYDSFSISRKYFKGEYRLENIDVYKMEMLCKSKEAINYCISLESNEYDYIHNLDSNVIEFYSKKDTKGSGILKVLEHLNIPIENSYAFGDGKNDIEMLETVGCGIAMGNASEKVKNHSKKITDTVQNDGIAIGIEKYIDL